MKTPISALFALVGIVPLFFYSCKTLPDQRANQVTIENSIEADSTNQRVEIYNFGISIPKKIQYQKFDDYHGIEMYTLASTNQVIQGVERFGPFRLYYHQEMENDSNYFGPPRVEFLNLKQDIIKTLNPFEESTLFNGHSKILNTVVGDGVNTFLVEVDNIERFFDPILIDSEYNMQEIKSGKNTLVVSCQYEIENHSLISILEYKLVVDEERLYKGFEVRVYDDLGTYIGSNIGIGPLSRVDITLDRQYLYLNTGGYVTSDQKFSRVFRIFNLTSNKLILIKHATGLQCLSGHVIPKTNLGSYEFRSECGTAFAMQESYLIDHDNNSVIPIHKHKYCTPPNEILIFDGYCECLDKDSRRNKVYYKTDFIITEHFND